MMIRGNKASKKGFAPVRVRRVNLDCGKTSHHDHRESTRVVFFPSWDASYQDGVKDHPVD